MREKQSEPEKIAVLEEEALIIRHAGEIPEVAFHGSLYYLSEDPAGPGLRLTAADLEPLQAAVLARYREIMRRDLDPANRDRRLYRGLARCIANWRRLDTFRQRQNLSPDPELRTEIGALLKDFLTREHADVTCGQRRSCINCTASSSIERDVVSNHLIFFSLIMRSAAATS